MKKYLIWSLWKKNSTIRKIIEITEKDFIVYEWFIFSERDITATKRTLRKSTFSKWANEQLSEEEFQIISKKYNLTAHNPEDYQYISGKVISRTITDWSQTITLTFSKN